MTMKRKQPEFKSEDTLYNKKSRLSHTDGSDDNPIAAQSRIDPTYGQRGAFPGLDNSVGEDELFYGPAGDGLEYLRMVRSEAKTVPNLLVAPISPTAQPKKSGLYEDYPQGYYADGAYTAIPLPSSTSALHHSEVLEDEDLDPQEAYYTSLLARFAAISSILQSPPPSTDAASLPNPHASLNSRLWRNKILKTTPKMALLGLLAQDTVVRALEVLEDVLTAVNLRGPSGKNVGAWAWGLLGRCRAVGMMGSEEVGVLRKVGKKAVWLLRRIAAGEVVEDEVVVGEDAEEESGDEDEAGERENGETVHDDEGGNLVNASSPVVVVPVAEGRAPHLPSVPREEDSSTALAEARQRMLASLNPMDEVQPVTEDPGLSNGSIEKQQHTKPGTAAEVNAETGPNVQTEQSGVLGDKESIHATLDMIVTIVGECYGQRDLLDGRLLWDEMA